jgi:hypothetical protein
MMIFEHNVWLRFDDNLIQNDEKLRNNFGIYWEFALFTAKKRPRLTIVCFACLLHVCFALFHVVALTTKSHSWLLVVRFP